MTEETQEKDETQELTEQLQRLQAEFDNYRKRVEKEQEIQRTRLTDSLVREMLPIMDNFSHALEHSKTEGKINADDLLKGLLMVKEQLTTTLQEQGVEEIPTEGKFDPQLHEAVSTQEGKEPGKIAKTFQKGYTRNGRLLRPARVSVTK